MKTKRIVALMATLLMGASTASAFSACGGVKRTDEGYDATKANLSVATFDGGIGRAWLDDAAARFMELHKDSTHFQEGRTGVNINIDAEKSKYSGQNLAGKPLLKDMYFTEGIDYYSFVNEGKVAPITDVVTNDLTAYGESGTIEEKLDSSFQEFLTAKDGNYYMLPFYDGFYGFIYDIDLFEEAGFYYDVDGDFLKLKKDEDGNASAEDRAEFEAAKANGPDGKKGTYDDGLPSTYAEFIALADHIVEVGYVPFCYSGTYYDYVDKACRAFIADYEGYEGFKANYTFDGTVEVVKNVISDWVVQTETVTLHPDENGFVENGYELQRQAGKYYALKMQETLFSNVNYLGGTWNGFDYTVAQAEFIKSKYSNKRYAMLLEGVWWENEAEPTFQLLETTRGEKKSDRNFGWLPMPKVDEDRVAQQQDQTLFSANSSFGFINASCENMELAKEFMRFLHTDAEMSKFTAKTSITRSLQYPIDDADKATATGFGKSIMEIRSNAKVVYPYSALNMVIDNASSFTQEIWYLVSATNGKNLKSPFNAFKNKTATAKDYFNGLYSYQKGHWNTLQK